MLNFRRAPITFCLVSFMIASAIAHPRPETGVAFGLIIDTSTSLRAHAADVKNAARMILEGQKGRAFLISFDDGVTLQRDFTSDLSSLQEELRSLIFLGGPTILLDAVFLSAKHLSESGTDIQHRALILITDGDERVSRHSEDELLETLRDEKIPIFAIAFTQALRRDRGKKIEKKAIRLLDSIAEESGGRAYFPDSEADLESVVNEILLRLQQ